MSEGFGPPGLILAAPLSGSGKTTVAVGLMRAFRARGLAVVPAKVGPDYIDPGFHRHAAGCASINLDGWAMRPATRDGLLPAGGDLVVAEGVMGLFDGAVAPGGCDDGSTAALARATGWPVVLVVDASRMGQSAGALVRGFAEHDRAVTVAGVLLNRVASPRHERLLAQGLAPLGLPLFGALPPVVDLALPSRHLGLVLAAEHPDLEGWIARMAALVAGHVDLDALQAAARPTSRPPGPPAVPLPPLGQRIAVARDAAFAFAYPHLLAGWRAAGAEIRPFSPLADAAPAADADAVYLPGGYPELHAGRLAAAARFRAGLAARVQAGAAVWGECGGYMALGRGLVDRDGVRHAMAGLLPVETSFAEPRRHLGYRLATLARDSILGAAGACFRGHEFHYARLAGEAAPPPLFTLHDAAGDPAGSDGCAAGRVAGAFLHIIDCAEG